MRVRMWHPRIMEAGAVLRTRSGRTVRPPARFSPERPTGGFEDDFSSDDYDEEGGIRERVGIGRLPRLPGQRRRSGLRAGHEDRIGDGRRRRRGRRRGER